MAREPEETVVLVDTGDRDIGTAGKLAAHVSGELHRAFSVMIWDLDGRLLLQRRHVGKYHSGGKWTNSCCGHPRPGEAVADAARRRLFEEMGIRCDLWPLGSLIYRADLDRGLVEHELVHVFRGSYGGRIAADPRECDGYDWLSRDEIARKAGAAPERFSAWFLKYVEAGWPLVPPNSGG